MLTYYSAEEIVLVIMTVVSSKQNLGQFIKAYCDFKVLKGT